MLLVLGITNNALVPESEELLPCALVEPLGTSPNAVSVALLWDSLSLFHIPRILLDAGEGISDSLGNYEGSMLGVLLVVDFIGEFRVGGS